MKDNFTLIEGSDGALSVCEAIRSLSDFAQCCAEQRTKRYEISEKCRLAAKAIDRDTEVIMKAIEANPDVRLHVLDSLDRIFALPSIDENMLRLAERAFDYLERTSAVAALRAAPPMPMLW